FQVRPLHTKYFAVTAEIILCGAARRRRRGRDVAIRMGKHACDAAGIAYDPSFRAGVEFLEHRFLATAFFPKTRSIKVRPTGTLPVAEIPIVLARIVVAKRTGGTITAIVAALDQLPERRSVLL